MSEITLGVNPTVENDVELSDTTLGAYTQIQAYSVLFGATIMPGVHIGNGAVVGSGAIVTTDVEPYSVVAGVPTKKLKMRFSDSLIEKIERSEWWDWDCETIRERLSDFWDMDAFVKKYL